MDLNFVESVIYGVVSGLAEFMPISTQAHRAILLKLFGAQSEGHLLRLMVHFGALAALLFACWGQIRRIRREQALAQIPKRRRKRQPDQKIMLDIKIIRTALIPALLGFVIYYYTVEWETKLSVIALFLILNGVFLFIPRMISTANKDSRSMSGLDSVLMGLCTALGMLPGISRTGFTTTAALIRGADRQQALNWSYLLSIPIMIVLIVIDIYGLFTVGAVGVTFTILLQYIVSMAASFGGAYLAISFMRFIAVNAGFTGFAYYSWGAALFAFIFYLTI